ncbi:tetratricopeptide repeat protein [Salibacterium halotolerans]|uniref:Tetratricopeptide repeat-containing protein n=1 Tax=Salibacterium halotolerans TaxID=1884432 RepID=A0A1I5PKV7_9BACI|nr:tetratricopeptide repeat protein [Salibacterium halotolerans]SFP34782.1 hypothetical protein SAMN05518683_104163 [Salibacterium halotolerans]
MGLMQWLKGGKQEEEKPAYPEINMEKKEQEIKDLRHSLESDTEPDTRVEKLNQLGAVLFQTGKVSEAIEIWEESVGFYEKPGYPHGKLMEAYTKKQTDAWKTGDDEASEYYAAKIDGLMKTNKDSIRYNN